QDYVRLRLPGVSDELAIQLHKRTDGSPLFLVNVIDYLLARGAVLCNSGRWSPSDTALVCENEVPESLREMIGRQLERVSQGERQVLEAASVVGAAFSSAAVAGALEKSVELVE